MTSKTELLAAAEELEGFAYKHLLGVKHIEACQHAMHRAAELRAEAAALADQPERGENVEVSILVPRELHEQTRGLVRMFASAMAAKLRKAEEKYGYSDGWRTMDWADECRAKLREHLAKGDPVDVANYCAFLFYHKASTAIADQPEPVAWRMRANPDYPWSYTDCTPHSSIRDKCEPLYAKSPSAEGRDGEKLALYNELILAVARKWPGQSRHETALMYIRQAESRESSPGQTTTEPDALPPIAEAPQQPYPSASSASDTCWECGKPLGDERGDVMHDACRKRRDSPPIAEGAK